MLKELDFEEFFKEENAYLGENGLGAVGVISPTQSVQVINIADKDKNKELKDGLGFHYTTLLYILKDMFNVDYNKKIVAIDTVVYREICKKIPNAEHNLILIRYIIQPDEFKGDTYSLSVVDIPMYITPYQLEELERINAILKSLNVCIDVKITNYNPITSTCENVEEKYFDAEPDQLDKAIDYLKSNNRVVEYQLPAEEKIVELKSNKKRTK